MVDHFALNEQHYWYFNWLINTPISWHVSLTYKVGRKMLGLNVTPLMTPHVCVQDHWMFAWTCHNTYGERGVPLHWCSTRARRGRGSLPSWRSDAEHLSTSAPGWGERETWNRISSNASFLSARVLHTDRNHRGSTSTPRDTLKGNLRGARYGLRSRADRGWRTVL